MAAGSIGLYENPDLRPSLRRIPGPKAGLALLGSEDAPVQKRERQSLLRPPEEKDP